MKDHDRKRFQEIVREGRAAGLSLTMAVEHAYAWLLKRSKDVWP